MSDVDGGIIGRIDELIAEEHELRRTAVGQGADADTQSRLKQIEEQLDQCWDLLRQRRARAEFNQDPDEAEVRPVSEVESYRQ
ncbi:DUF2630 family protein [Fodinicola acaciae]|uniref:DUF2630 family protein n=1 Tax=Fodinicola acaciae TaxID=2681555 RepID=UPI0013D13F8D|nr:DUF2630 family protein [Fodinicola acaciae]